MVASAAPTSWCSTRRAVALARAVVRAIAAARPRAVAYVACDPVALARDLATFANDGYTLAELVGLDLFPTTHHVECVALLERKPQTVIS